MAATENTTHRSGSNPRNAVARPLLRIIVIFLSSGFLLYLAYPRLQASLLYLPVDTATSNYYDTRETPSGQLQGLRQRAQDSIEIYPHHRYWEGLSLLHYLQAADKQNALHQRRKSFEQSIIAAEASLEIAPTQPRTWLRIAQARAWLRYPPEEVIDAFKMAIYTGRVEPSMFMTRLLLGLAYLPRMDAEGVAMMRDQVLLAWQLQPREVTRALQDRSLRYAGLEQLLSEAHSGVLSEIEESTGGAVR
jgi:hypothetical protein